MGALRLILTIVLILVSVLVTAVILMQEGKDQGLGAISGAAETYLGKNKGRSLEGRLLKWTTILMVAFSVLTILLDMNLF
ncbi:MAG: preprotein translocase subunit SecG [Lachnospiraceae bacterium]|jgi:preprotein translocase subunit SecG|nr:preprotein translocase subunit SecG [Lachnospiraceae bacterium]